MSTEHGKLGHERRRGDGLFVTLLFVAAASLAAAVFACTQAFITPSDAIRSFIPRNAVAYLHAGGRSSTEALLSSSSQMPSGIRPDEVAVFAVPGDDSLRWSVIIAWRWPRTPTPDELRMLDERDAIILDAGRYLIGDSALATTAKVSAAAHASLADDPERSAALDLMLSVSSMQFYADPAALLSPETVFALAELSDGGLPPIVAGIKYKAGSLAVRILPVADAAARQSFLGYGETAVRGERLDTGRLDADVAIAEGSPTIDLAKLMLGTPRRAGHPSPVILSDAGDSLREELSIPYALWLRTDPKTGNPDYLLRFPDVPPSRTKLVIARYFAAAEPSRTVMTLPDGDLAVEFHIEDAGTDQMTAYDEVFTVPRGSGLEHLVVGSDGADGSLIASAAALVTEFRSKTDLRPPIEDSCSSKGLKAVIRLLKPLQTLAGIPQAKDLISALGVSDLTIGLTVDGEIRICG